MCRAKWPARKKLREHRLLRHRRVHVARESREPHRIHERRRQHEIAHAQPRRDRLAEAADVDHPPRAVERLHRGNRIGIVAILAVVVILEHPRIRARGPVEQREPALERERDAERSLIRWRHEREPRVRRATLSLVHIDPLLIHRNAHERRAGRTQRRAHRPPSRILHPRGVARIEKEPRHEIDAVLRAVHHEHLIRRASHAARGHHVLRDRLAQRRIAAHVREAEHLACARAPESPDQPRPERHRKFVDRRNAERERNHAKWRTRKLELIDHRHRRSRQLGRAVRRARPAALDANGGSSVSRPR